MKTNDVLPEKWERVAVYRRRKLRNHDLQHPEEEKKDDTCLGCEACRIIVTDDYLLHCCIFNKCIKAYPHKIDNKEFT